MDKPYLLLANTVIRVRLGSFERTSGAPDSFGFASVPPGSLWFAWVHTCARRFRRVDSGFTWVHSGPRRGRPVDSGSRREYLQLPFPSE